MLSATNGLRARGDSRCSARATSSLPVPVSPVISTDERRLRQPADGAEQLAHRRRVADQFGGAASSVSDGVASLRVARVGGGSARRPARPHRPGRRAWTGIHARRRGTRRRCWRCRCRRSSRSPAAAGAVALSASRKPRPSMPGMRTSVNTSVGRARAPAHRAPSRALSKSRTAIAGFAQRLGQHEAHRAVVVDDPDRCACVRSACSERASAASAIQPTSPPSSPAHRQQQGEHRMPRPRAIASASRDARARPAAPAPGPGRCLRRDPAPAAGTPARPARRARRGRCRRSPPAAPARMRRVADHARRARRACAGRTSLAPASIALRTRFHSACVRRSASPASSRQARVVVARITHAPAGVGFGQRAHALEHGRGC